MATIELFGRAQILAGSRHVDVHAGTVAEAFRQLAERYPQLVGPVLLPGGLPTPAYSVNLRGQRFIADLSQAIPDDEEILLISSLSGG